MRDEKNADKVTIHDPCSVRFEVGIHDSVRKLIGNRGRQVEEMAHSGRKTLCCGEGGAVGALVPGLTANWGKLRQEECAGRKIITYCAGCANMLSPLAPTAHLLDILWEGENGRAKVAKSPFTYWKRLKMKTWFKKHVPAAITRERTFTGVQEPKKGTVTKLLVFLIFLAAVIVAVKTSGISRYLEQDILRTWIGSYGALAPVIYMLIYAVAPVFFLPALPFTVVGGILFGPWWGVVYAITGSTAGACTAGAESSCGGEIA